MWVSTMTLLSRPQPGQIDGFVLDAVTGEPVAGADVNMVFRNGPRYQYGPKTRTDADGHFSIPRTGQHLGQPRRHPQGHRRAVPGG